MKLHTLSRMRIAMGTFVVIEAEAAHREAAERGVAAAFAAINLAERLLHPCRPGSDLARLAGAPRALSVKVHPWTWEVLDISRRLNEWSQGAFDPCLDTAPGRIADIDLSRRGHAVPRARVQVDLGGIGKGFAVDRAIDALRASGCLGGLVNAGGDLAVFGHRRHPILRASAGGAGCVLELKDAALASSDTGQAARPAEHRGYYHGTDRRRGFAGSVTIMAQTAVIADALTKCALVGGARLERSMPGTFGANVLRFD